MHARQFHYPDTNHVLAMFIKAARCLLLKEDRSETADPIQALLDGKIQSVEYSNGSVIIDAPRAGRVYMAGSFNPLHEGHRGMLAAALKARQDKQGKASPFISTHFCDSHAHKYCVLHSPPVLLLLVPQAHAPPSQVFMLQYQQCWKVQPVP